MSQAIPVRTDYTAGEVRRFAQRAKDAAQARRLLAVAAVLDGDVKRAGPYVEIGALRNSVGHGNAGFALRPAFFRHGKLRTKEGSNCRHDPFSQLYGRALNVTVIDV